MSNDLSRNSNKWLNASRERQNYLREKCTYYSNRIMQKKEQEDRIETRRKLHGNGKYTEVGIIARIFNHYIVEPEMLTKENDIISFYDGYINYANSQLLIMNSENKISEKVKSCLEKFKITIEEKPVEEILYEVGCRDAMDENIDYSKIPANLKNNENYAKGYESSNKRKEV